MKKTLLLIVVASIFAAMPAVAKEGLYVGGYAITRSKITGVTDVGSGSGYGIRAGLGFNRYLAIEASYETTEQDMAFGTTADLKGYAIDGKLNFPLTSLDSRNVMRLEPFIKGGYAFGYDLKIPLQETSSGKGAQYGFGLELYLFQELSISAGCTRTKVRFGSPLNHDGRTRKFDVGLNYHFI